MMTNASRSVTPGSATPPDCGNQDCAEAYWISESMMPMPSRRAHAIAERGEPRDQRGGERRDDLQRQRLGSSWVIEAARMPSPPAISEASSVFVSEMSSATGR